MFPTHSRELYLLELVVSSSAALEFRMRDDVIKRIKREDFYNVSAAIILARYAIYSSIRPSIPVLER
jgi:hypothetical protein